MQASIIPGTQKRQQYPLRKEVPSMALTGAHFLHDRPRRKVTIAAKHFASFLEIVTSSTANNIKNCSWTSNFSASQPKFNRPSYTLYQDINYVTLNPLSLPASVHANIVSLGSQNSAKQYLSRIYYKVDRKQRLQNSSDRILHSSRPTVSSLYSEPKNMEQSHSTWIHQKKYSNIICELLFL